MIKPASTNTHRPVSGGIPYTLTSFAVSVAIFVSLPYYLFAAAFPRASSHKACVEPLHRFAQASPTRSRRKAPIVLGLPRRDDIGYSWIPRPLGLVGDAPAAPPKRLCP